MIRLKSVPLFGTGIAGKSFTVTRQRRLNVYFEVREDKDKTRIAIYGTPGLVHSFTATTPQGPIRGMLGTKTALFLAGNTRFQSVKPDGTEISGGNLLTAFGPLSMSSNSTQVVIADGLRGYVYSIPAGTFQQIPAAFPNTARTVTYVSSFFVAEQPGTQKFWVSNSNDATTWDGLAVAQASSNKGNILAVDALSGNLLIFCEDHMEFWQNVGAAPEPFAPILSASNEYGIAAIFSRGHLAQSVIFLAQNEEGQVQICQVTGYDIKVISTPDLDFLMNSFETVSDAEAMTYGVDSHKFYQITFPSEGRSFLFDDTTKLWSETQTGASVIPARHRGRFSTSFKGKNLVSDYQTGQIYTLDPGAYTDNGDVIPREIISRHILSDFNKIRISQLYLDMETGVGTQTGQGYNPQIMLQYSKDNGRTWSAERWSSLGLVGQYLTRVIWRRFGSTRDATFKIRMTDPVKFVITDAAIKIREKNHQQSGQQQQQGHQ